jgi:hypothetical protein
VGNGNTDVGNNSPPHKPDQPKISRVRPDDAKVSGAKVSGAMSQQQRGDCGNESAPQKFLQLVGCREPKVRPEPWVRPRAPQG